MNKPGSLELAHERIARLAYQLWEKAGRCGGHELEHWLQAENQLRPQPGPVGHNGLKPKRGHSPMVVRRSANGSPARP
jgi:hypothetical protein